MIGGVRTSSIKALRSAASLSDGMCSPEESVLPDEPVPVVWEEEWNEEVPE